MGSWVADDVVGTRGGLPPDAASWKTALDIETSIADQFVYCSMSADLKECFDQVSRAHLMHLCLAAGFPRG
eukprot:15460685-Alexandrium_andersonii.AAC.1